MTSGASGAAVGPASNACVSETLGAWLLRRRLVSPAALERAERRRALYGGALDTALLEGHACDEPTLTRALAEASGLEASEGPLTRPGPEATSLLDARRAKDLGAIAVHADDTGVDLVLAPHARLCDVRDWAARVDRTVGVIAIAGEPRWHALFALAYDDELPPRFATLLGKVLGPAGARRWAAALRPGLPHRPERASLRVDALTAPQIAAATATRQAASEAATAPEAQDGHPATAPEAQDGHPATAPEAQDGHSATAPEAQDGHSATAPEAQDGDPATASEARDADPATAPEITAPQPSDLNARLAAWRHAPEGAERRAALRGLRMHTGDERVQGIAAALRADAERTTGARCIPVLGAIAALGDAAAVPLLIRRLGDRGAVASAAHAALVEITRQDFGHSRWRWLRWWQRASAQHRVEWLLDALDHRQEELRLAASLELQPLFGSYFGYHFDLGRRERQEAQRRLQAFWAQRGRRDLPNR